MTSEQQKQAAKNRWIRECRSLLIDFLNGVFPGSLPEADIFDTMLGLPSPIGEHDVRRDLGYLAGRNLIRRERVTNPITSRPEIRWTLTPEGVTFCERGKPWNAIEDV